MPFSLASQLAAIAQVESESRETTTTGFPLIERETCCSMVLTVLILVNNGERGKHPVAMDNAILILGDLCNNLIAQNSQTSLWNFILLQQIIMRHILVYRSSVPPGTHLTLWKGCNESDLVIEEHYVDSQVMMKPKTMAT